MGGDGLQKHGLRRRRESRRHTRPLGLQLARIRVKVTPDAQARLRLPGRPVLALLREDVSHRTDAAGSLDIVEHSPRLLGGQDPERPFFVKELPPLLVHRSPELSQVFRGLSAKAHLSASLLHEEGGGDEPGAAAAAEKAAAEARALADAATAELAKQRELDTKQIRDLKTELRSEAIESARIIEDLRGAHAREDTPDRLDDEWMKHTMCYFDEATNKTTVTYRPIHNETLDADECPVVPPVARVY